MRSLAPKPGGQARNLLRPRRHTPRAQHRRTAGAPATGEDSLVAHAQRQRSRSLGPAELRPPRNFDAPSPRDEFLAGEASPGLPNSFSRSRRFRRSSVWLMAPAWRALRSPRACAQRSLRSGRPLPAQSSVRARGTDGPRNPCEAGPGDHAKVLPGSRER